LLTRYENSVDNPLIYQEPAEQERAVRQLHHSAPGLADACDVNLLLRGAALARDEELFLSSPGLTEVERRAVEREKEAEIWDQPKELKTILLTCCIGAIVQ